MAERKRSTSGTRETEQVLGVKPEELEDQPSAAGRFGGEIARKVGTRDEGKRHDETSAGTTRVLGQDQNRSGDKEKV
ncbi:hypothetical protein [Primorskyibacter sedentarius]|uniref:Uncharacterized protein n=1 Tax=Primorskyibacter sedentarius TaxID=745311 RepID=A0A4R3JE77_9RHOB|nr:hypothetical protein [Primorskyibacter sedentarius]TCS63745.1 hypothetical protein EDD52_10612 [Primorskyibacter sedentarius]